MSKTLMSSFLSLLAATTLAAQATPAKAPSQEKPKPSAPAPKAEAKKAAPAVDAKAAATEKPAVRRADGTTATVDDIKNAQKALAAKGLYKGAVSGRLNKDFKAALTEFQKQNGLKPTGRLNQETIAKLKA